MGGWATNKQRNTCGLDGKMNSKQVIMKEPMGISQSLPSYNMTKMMWVGKDEVELCVRNDCPAHAFFFVFPFVSLSNPHSFIMPSYVPIYSCFSSLTLYLCARYSAR